MLMLFSLSYIITTWVEFAFRLSWLGPAEMKENINAHVHQAQSITLIGSSNVYMEPLLHASSYANYRLDKKKVCAGNMCMNGMILLSNGTAVIP